MATSGQTAAGLFFFPFTAQPQEELRATSGRAGAAIGAKLCYLYQKKATRSGDQMALYF
jgi:hypothetical protein